jgi:hypothetical protein
MSSSTEYSDLLARASDGGGSGGDGKRRLSCDSAFSPPLVAGSLGCLSGRKCGLKYRPLTAEQQRMFADF